MPRLIPSAAGAPALLLLLLALTAASARGAPPELRVVGAGGRVLVEEHLRAGTTRLPTSPKATCLGRGTGGSGAKVTVKGPTALGLLGRAARSNPDLRPLLITDHFLSEFGLGLCGVGGTESHGSYSWYLKVNHRDPQRGGDSVKVHAGDEVLWAFAPYPYPKELSLVAPASASPGIPFEVTVYTYDDKGKKRPAAGATVTGALLPTDAEGHTTVTLGEGESLVARLGKDIPSASRAVAICPPNGACPGP